MLGSLVGLAADNHHVSQILDGQRAASAVVTRDAAVADLRHGQLVEPHLATTANGIGDDVAGLNGPACEIDDGGHAGILLDLRCGRGGGNLCLTCLDNSVRIASKAAL